MGIIRQRLHLFPADRPIPPVIYQYIFISHCSCQIDVPHLILIIDTSILPQNPAPGSTPETIIVNRFVKWLHDVPNDCRFHNRLQIIPYARELYRAKPIPGLPFHSHYSLRASENQGYIIHLLRHHSNENHNSGCPHPSH